MKHYKESSGWRFEFGETEKQVWRRNLDDENKTSETIWDILDADDNVIGLIVPFEKVRVAFGWLDIQGSTRLRRNVVLELDGEKIKKLDVQ